MLMLIASSAAFAQERTIRGTVTDESNLPLPGVVVTVKSTGKATSTSANGIYQVVVSGADDVIKFTFLGSLPKEVIVGDKKVVNVTMVTDTKQLK
ncbi:MAG: SusC/RagA family TonB-linked outer membrane protein, partial [Mucilaginibacter sp.]|nr:SusC/RagA family TonB-linked outer membrane protein [Mucilaginibacter sp.]